MFQRIYYHHFEQQTLEHETSLKEHLNVYLNGFDELKEAYSIYPDACFYVSSMIKVGNLLQQAPKQSQSGLANEPTNLSSRSLSTTRTNTARHKMFNTMLLNSSIRLFAALNDAKSKRKELDIEPLLGDVFEASIKLSSQDW